MSDFHQWFAAVTAEAIATEVGQTLAGAGFGVEHTGGGCLAWERRGADGGYVYITDDDSGLGVDGLATAWYVCQYDHEGEDQRSASFGTVAEALAQANEWLPLTDLDRAVQKAAAVSNLDDAAVLVQDAMGVTDGGLAALYFSGKEADWPNMHPLDRYSHLTGYVRAERNFARPEG